MSLVCMMLSAGCRRCIWVWWVNLRGSMVHLRMVLVPNTLSVGIERMWSCLLASSAMAIAASSVRLIMCLSGWDCFFNMRGSVSSWVDYGCPQRGVTCDQGFVRVDEICWVPYCMIWADLWRVICVCLRGYGGVWVLVGLHAVKMGGVV